MKDKKHIDASGQPDLTLEPAAAGPSGKPITLADEATASRVEEDYAATGPYQAALEIVRNALQQPGTRNVWVDVVETPTGAYKRVFANDGPAMSIADLEAYFSTLGSGSGDIWRLRNTLGSRHAGARTALLPYTDLAVVTWDADELPDGALVVLYFDATSDAYCYTDPSAPDPALLKAVLTGRAEIRESGSGVAFVLLGRDRDADGPFSNADKGETDYGLIQALRERVYQPVCIDGSGVRITVAAPMPDRAGSSDARAGGRRITINGAPHRLDSRVMHGHAAWADSKTHCSGRVLVDAELDVWANWTLIDASVAKSDADRHRPFVGKGHICARYKDELVVLGAVGDDYPDLPRVMRTFGVSLAEVYNRLSIVLEGRTDPGSDPDNPMVHLHQTPARSGIMRSDGRDLNIAAWGQAFVDAMPPEIAAASKAASEKVATRGQVKFSAGERIKRTIGSRLSMLKAARRARTGSGILGRTGRAGTDLADGSVRSSEAIAEGARDGDGAPGMTPGGTKRHAKSAKKRRGARQLASVAPTGTTSRGVDSAGAESIGEVSPGRLEVPEPVPYSAAAWVNAGFDEADFAVWDAALNVVYFNLGHPILHVQYQYFEGEWLEAHPGLRRRVTPEIVREAVYEAYAADTIGRILHHVDDVGPAQAREDLTDRMLTIGARGFENVQAAIEKTLESAGRHGVVRAGEQAA